MTYQRETASDLLEQAQQMRQRLLRFASSLIWEANNPQQVQLAHDALNGNDAAIDALLDLMEKLDA
jgi:hypothetical protein